MAETVRQPGVLAWLQTTRAPLSYSEMSPLSAVDSQDADALSIESFRSEDVDSQELNSRTEAIMSGIYTP